MKQKQKKLWLDIRKNAGLYALVAIPIIWYIVFKYIPHVWASDRVSKIQSDAGNYEESLGGANLFQTVLSVLLF